ncbi:MAG: hypothetical protein FIB07_14310 [Candidatus Methanoperedens sp.]|nr:hypothetical protein [Candidatus Methanoperedens sp.]
MKYKNWSKSKKIVIAILLVPGILIAANALNILFSGLIILTDQAQYSSYGSNLGQINYDKVISSAKKTGYTVEEPEFLPIGVHPPSNIADLDERLGKDYRFLSTAFFYRENVYFLASEDDFSEDSTPITFFIEKSPYTGAPIKLEDLPPDEWIVEKFKLMFGLTEPESRNYLTQLKDSIRKNHETHGSIIIKKVQNLQAVYSNLNASSTSSNFTSSGSEGVTETFYNKDKKMGTLEFLVPNVRIIFQDKEHEYGIRIDSSGGVALWIILGVREEIPEEEYRRIFKKMFANIGLQPEKVDEFEFNYVPSKLNGN